MTKMSDLTNEQIAAKVAADVMGWRVVNVTEFSDRGWDECVVLRGEDDSEYAYMERGTTGFHPCLRPDHDYLVLQRVRETWSAERQAEFIKHLMVSAFNNASRLGVRQDQQFPALFYIPGDYARAALAVKEAE